MEQQEYLTFVAVSEKSTVRTIRFEEVVPPGGEAIANYFYLQKKALARIANPGMVEITIRAVRKE